LEDRLLHPPDCGHTHREGRAAESHTAALERLRRYRMIFDASRGSSLTERGKEIRP
jgi:hypothetical protein